MVDLDSVFAEDGLLAQAVGEYRFRPQQIGMARAVAEAIDRNSILLAEAGTGTGKTFAYLAPALLSGAKVIISTGTKNLQDQLFYRDIPVVRAALKIPVSVSLLKGRANYVCRHHLERAVADGHFASRDDALYIAAIARYAKTSRSGDKGGLSEVPETAAVWSYATSTRDNCLGGECGHYKECFVMEARKEALAADVVVVNHHLFFADVMLRDEGIVELLPACNAVIFDEAHQLPETAGIFFGHSVSTAQLIELARDARLEAVKSAGDFIHLPEACVALDRAARDLRLALASDNARLPATALANDTAFNDALTAVLGKLAALGGLLAAQAERSDGLRNCAARAEDLSAQLTGWQTAARDPLVDDEFVRWIEVFNQSLQLHATPLSIARIFRKQLQASARAWIFTSATLAVNRDFSHYAQQLGLSEIPGIRAECWDSPFDYPTQALLYVPNDLPEPNSLAHTAALIQTALPVLRASSGRAFLLCTSLRAMRDAHRLLQQAFADAKLDFPLLLQSEATRTELLERFRRLGNAVLIGSQSFWEGVDVRGEALSLVIIDKLPFASPDDPVLAARIARMQAEGQNAFMSYQLPRAAIALKQGAGRLIRDENDRGVLMICDPRLISKPYGRKLWQSLPPMKRTRELREVEEFFRSVAADETRNEPCRAGHKPLAQQHV
ncbi:MAG: ATP-dependent DNA helicase [Burkholderiales bacterium]|nr:ATP-dependent DNA helicase [Burkholderiales bacterium]